MDDLSVHHVGAACETRGSLITSPCYERHCQFKSIDKVMSAIKLETWERRRRGMPMFCLTPVRQNRFAYSQSGTHIGQRRRGQRRRREGAVLSSETLREWYARFRAGAHGKGDA